ncbi:sugar phosphate permease [Roseiarcus fermentans]|uniref:Sugar phosphate permease n=1 Tax=Roseiarcus fermentans TaxID=1473586 RepID=A0A366FSW0_9HYPH|nr:MFS transporter [Roseiarcus fermentans]RBP17657.1 sugar phosphate permease [Roseiarcus fermentans]
MAVTTSAGSSVLDRMDEAKLNRLHWKIMFISGMGFLTDAYDLFIIGVVMALLKEQWSITPTEEGLVASTALIASAVGAVLFGRIADMLGRKRIYGYEVLVLAIGSVASALSPSIWWLIVFRIILGLGIGGDYPVSSTIMSEYASRKTRGMMVTLVFTMQAAGLVLGPLLAAGLLTTHLSHDTIWRLLLAFGAIPAMAVFQLRRQMAETPRYLLATGQHEAFGEAAAHVLGQVEGRRPEGAAAGPAPRGREPFWSGFATLTRNPVFLSRLVGASLAWAFMDFAYYGNTVSSPMVLAAISPDKSLLNHTLTQLAIFAVAAAPGYLLAAATMDRIGRKSIQIVGFVMMAITFGAIALIPDVEHLVLPFLIIYGVSYFFTEFGPNSTTFVYPAEIFPVRARTTGHGVAAAAGKLGGFFGVFLFPILMAWGGLIAAEAAAAAVSVFGALVTLTLLPETKGRSLEELSPEESPA